MRKRSTGKLIERKQVPAEHYPCEGPLHTYTVT